MRRLAFVLFPLAVGAACSSFSEADNDPPDASGDEAGVDGANDGGTTVETDATTRDASLGPPVLLAHGLSDLQGVDLNATTVYFVEHGAGQVMSIGLESDSGAPTLLTGNLAASPSSILAFTSGAVWGDLGHAMLGAQISGSPYSAKLLSGPTAIARRTTNDGFVVASAMDGGGGTIQGWNLPLTVLSAPYYTSPDGNLFDVAVTADSVYWTESNQHTVRGVALGPSPSTAEVVSSSESGCESIAADDKGVYWTLPSTNTIRQREDGGASDFITNEQRPFSLAVDRSGLYWMTTDGNVRRSRRDGSPIETLASNVATSGFGPDYRAQAIALSDRYVVWITSNGEIWRLAK